MLLIGTAGRLLVAALQNEHIRAAGHAVFRGATRELVRHLQARYGK